MARIHSTQKDFMSNLVTRVLSYPSLQRERGCFMRSDQLAKLKKNCESAIWNFQWFEAICPINGFFFTFDKRKCELPYYIRAGGKKAWDRALSLLSPYHRLVIRWLLHSHTNNDRESGWGLDCKTVGFFFSKSVKKSVKHGVRVLGARRARASHLLFDC